MSRIVGSRCVLAVRTESARAAKGQTLGHEGIWPEHARWSSHHVWGTTKNESGFGLTASVVKPRPGRARTLA